MHKHNERFSFMRGDVLDIQDSLIIYINLLLLVSSSFVILVTMFQLL